MVVRVSIVLAVAAASVVFVPASLAQPAGPAVPVPSHQPRLTHALWSKLVHRPRKPAAAASCQTTRVVVYTSDDWLRLATKLAANPAPCAQYFISIPPLAADKTNFRSAQPAQIRALGPQFHVLAEISYNGWSAWVTQNNATFYDAGVEARRRMAAQGFDVGSGDGWIVNELSSALRANTGTSRQKIRDLVRGLYDGDGAMPHVKGGVYVIGLSQATTDLRAYKLALQSWYADGGFWTDMDRYVSDWAQEVYGDVRAYAVGGAPPAARVASLNEYLQHPLSLAQGAPAEAATAAAYLEHAYVPLANAAWAYDSGFGFTNVPVDVMQDYVSAQVNAMRTAGTRLGLAWAPNMPDGSPWTSTFTVQTAQVLDRLAAAIHDADGAPDGACGTAWCTSVLPGAAFNSAWQTFAAWSPPELAFANTAATVQQGGAAELDVELRQAGGAQPVGTPTTVSFAASSASTRFAPSAAGPWTSTLAVTVPAGATTASVFFRADAAGTATVTASAAGRQSVTQDETVTAAASTPPTAPPSGSSGGGFGGIPPDIALTGAASSAVVPAVGGELDVSFTVASANDGGSSDVGLHVDLPAGYALSHVYTDRGACSIGEGAVSCDVAWINRSTSTHVTIFGTVTQPAELRFAGAATSRLEPELDPANNSATVVVRLAQAAPIPAGSAGAPAAARPLAVLRAPWVIGTALVGRTLRVAVPIWTNRPTRVAYRWQICRGSRCTTVAGAALRLRAAYAGRTVRVLATARIGSRTATASSARVLVRRR